MKVVGPVMATNGIPYLQMASAESHSISEREREWGGEEDRLGINNVYNTGLGEYNIDTSAL